MKKNAIWISFDLGVRGDYEEMYAWLANHGAKECGDSLAFINYEYKKDLLKELKVDVEHAIKATKRTRVYAIHLDPDTKKMKGTFLIGGRRVPPWAGFAAGAQEEDTGA
ncbi:MAG TPA: hypothetical protein VGN42_05920 [Pirellulales bacterium]|jgi:hypothetical protein|nr:hypothetical protein [Pirellulales bacterium]